MITTNFGE